ENKNLSQERWTTVMRVALISLARRGGMVQYHGSLVNALGEVAPIVSVTAKSAAVFFYSEKLIRLTVDTGVGALGTLFNTINPLFWYRLIKTLRAIQADVFHLTVPHEWNPIIGLLVRMMRKPLIFTMHDPEHHRGTPLYMQVSDNFTARIADAIVVLSKLGREQLLKKGFPRDRLNYIPLGVPTFLMNGDAKSMDREKVILFFGRIEPYKGLEILLRAFTQIVDDLAEWKLVIAGNGDLSSCSTYLDHPQIEVINRFIDDNEVAGLMQRASLVALPYIEATQSAVIPIAYAFARPVIVSDVGSLKEVVIHEKTGLLIPPNNINELAEAIRKMTADPARLEQMGQYAYEMSN